MYGNWNDSLRKDLGILRILKDEGGNSMYKTRMGVYKTETGSCE